MLLAPNVVATAGHCTVQMEPWNERTVIVGRTDLSTTDLPRTADRNADPSRTPTR
ncbi:hypothetical protein EV193_102112 [Herbihabitans rhizosphaerae]|uniref:Trypsin n=1 Tax=Herbihabitans rhizosphaerae TaxID=1872711 RepID=A0A4Q7L235_9PSEU|nr:hypothetical protein EV193_102112 [Herbihabitans rhizosphaerae]